MKKHKIGWLNVPGYIPQTWNPIVGCSKISAGCRNCYAERMACRLAGMTLDGYIEAIVNRQWNGQTYLLFDALQKPIHWNKPRAIFVNSMGDLFHENTPDEWIYRVFTVMALCPQHLFIVLTKRAERMEDFILSEPSYNIAQHEDWYENNPSEQAEMNIRAWMHKNTPLPNVWLGVTAENQEAADERIPHLLNTPAAVRFISCEPLIGPIEFDDDWLQRTCTKCGSADFGPCKNDGPQCWSYSTEEEGELCGCRTSTGLDWIICGGESGSGARTMQYQWAESLRDQAKAASVPFFFKQWGAKPPTEYHRCEWKDLMLDGKRYHEFPIVGNGSTE